MDFTRNGFLGIPNAYGILPTSPHSTGVTAMPFGHPLHVGFGSPFFGMSFYFDNWLFYCKVLKV